MDRWPIDRNDLFDVERRSCLTHTSTLNNQGEGPQSTLRFAERWSSGEYRGEYSGEYSGENSGEYTGRGKRKSCLVVAGGA